MGISRLQITGFVKKRCGTVRRRAHSAEPLNSWHRRYEFLPLVEQNIPNSSNRFYSTKNMVAQSTGGHLAFSSTKCFSNNLPSVAKTKTKFTTPFSPTSPSIPSTCPVTPSQSSRNSSRASLSSVSDPVRQMPRKL